MKASCRLTAILVFGIASAACGQQSAPPPPAQIAQQLASDMQIIQKELNSVGKLNFVVHVSNADEIGTSQYSVLLTEVAADPAACSIHYHWWRSISGNVVNDEDVSLSLRDVMGVLTMPSDQYFKKVAEEEGAAPDEMKVYYEKFDPPMFIVAMRVAADDADGFSFTDQKQASRVGEAVTQAVKLCGGKPDPF